MSIKDQQNAHNFFAFRENLSHGIQSIKLIDGLRTSQSKLLDEIDQFFQELQKFRQHLNVKRKMIFY